MNRVHFVRRCDIVIASLPVSATPFPASCPLRYLCCLDRGRIRKTSRSRSRSCSRSPHRPRRPHRPHPRNNPLPLLLLLLPQCNLRRRQHILPRPRTINPHPTQHTPCIVDGNRHRQHRCDDRVDRIQRRDGSHESGCCSSYNRRSWSQVSRQDSCSAVRRRALLSTWSAAGESKRCLVEYSPACSMASIAASREKREATSPSLGDSRRRRLSSSRAMMGIVLCGLEGFVLEMDKLLVNCVCLL